MRLSEIVKGQHDKDKTGLPVDDEGKFVEARKLCDKATHELDHIAQSVKAGKSFEIGRLLKISIEFVESLMSDHHLFLQGLYQKEENWNLAKHSISVVVVCFKLGLGLGYKRKNINSLVFAAFLHDIGMITVPEKLLNKPGRYTKEEYDRVKRHSTATYNILKKVGIECSKTAEIVYQEHEREDGSGYPRGLKGDEIHEYAKIIGLADVYSALINARAYRKRYIPFEAVKKVIARYKGCYSKKLMKGMINVLSAFPPGIYVKLNTGEMGRVTTTNRLTPLRPTVEILFDSERRFVEDTRQMDLSKHHLISITETYFNVEEADD